MGEAIIVDNTPSDSFCVVLSRGLFSRMPRIVRNEKNQGIAKALNQGIRLARELGYQWVITFDQDTVVNDNFISQMSLVYDRISATSIHSVAVLGPNYIDQVLQSSAHAVVISEYAVEVREVITSGSLISIEAFTAVGGFEEKLFIDMVDTDFCFRVRQKGYSVWRTSATLMDHSLGRLSTRHILGFSFNVTNHLPQRRYYIFRNTLFMVWKYKYFDPRWALQMIGNYLPKIFIKACVFETKRWRNFLFILRGIHDALLSRYDRNYL